jgi:hypothetical protein
MHKTGLHGGSRRVAQAISLKFDTPISSSTVLRASEGDIHSPKKVGRPCLLTKEQELLILELISFMRETRDKLQVP